MILIEKELIKMINAAYKRERLYITNFGDEIIIHTDRFAAMIPRKDLVGKLLGKVYELTGGMPPEGFVCQYGKKMRYLEEKDTKDRWDETFKISTSEKKLRATNMIIERYGTEYRVLESEDKRKHLYPEECLKAIKYTHEVEGPYTVSNDADRIIFYDDEVIYLIWQANMQEEEETVKSLTGIDINNTEKYIF